MVESKDGALSDPGKVRTLVARWTFEGRLTLVTACHLGAGEGEGTDMAVVRDPVDGSPLLLGTSLGGALRSHLADLLGGYGSREDPRVAVLFGGERGDDVGGQSPLVIFDAPGDLPTGLAIEIRDGLKIDGGSATAEDKKKFDYEVLPAGTQFRVRFDLLVPTKELEAELVGLLAEALSGLAPGEIAIGARRSRGLGAIEASDWTVVRYDLSTRQGWLNWLLGAGTPVAGLGDACERILGRGILRVGKDARSRARVEVYLDVRQGLLVRGVPSDPESPDAVPLESAGRAILPGTSVGGVLRQQALRIAHLVRNGKGDAQAIVDGMFGPLAEEPEGASLFASRLRVSENLIEEPSRVRGTRIAIDRFTQGVVSGAMLDEEVVGGGRIVLTFELRKPRRGELGLLLLLVKDVMTGEVAFGGSASVGRGRLTGTGALLVAGARIALDPAGAAVAEEVERAIRELWECPARGGNDAPGD